ncbi:MAG: peptidase M48 Ste24p [Deltaproteobacteria bacterium]|nr:MAG: peptidase M48 Ste24p [Deltaproteobacteria bacterium]
MRSINIEIDAKKIALSFFLVVIFLLMVNMLGLFLFFTIDEYKIFGIVYWFDFDHENNIPAIYSGFTLLFCSLLLFIISISKKNQYTHCAYWAVLSILFAYLSFDEVLVIHEQIGDMTEQFVTAEGFLFFPWVIPYGLLLICFVITYARFLFALPRKTMILFIASGVIFIAGALGFEVFSAKEAYLHGYNSIKYCILYTCEEFCEMSGIVLFLYALLLYLKEEINYLSLYKIRTIYFK